MSAGSFVKARAIFTASAQQLSSIAGTTNAQLHAAYLRQLEAEVLTGDYALASRTAQGLLAISKTTEELAQVHFQQGRIALERGEFDAALGYFERAMAGGGASADFARVGIAETLRRQEKYTEASRAFAEASSLLSRDGRPASREVILGPLEILVSLGKYAEAQLEIESVRKAWKPGKSHPDTIHLRNLAGFVAYRLGDLNLASKEVSGTSQLMETIAGVLHPDFTESIVMEAIVAAGRGEDRIAQAGFDRVTRMLTALPETSPKKTRLQLVLGSNLLTRGDAAGARAQFLGALQLSKLQLGEDSLASAHASVMLALSEINANRHALAEGYLNRAERVFETRQVAIAHEYRLAADFAMGEVLHQKKDTNGSKKLLNRWMEGAKLRGEVGGVRVREILAEILISEGQASASAKLLQQALDIESLRASPAATARISLKLAKARSKAGDLPGAISAFEALLARAEFRNELAALDVAGAHQMLGDIYTKMRLPSDAATAYLAALKILEGRVPTSDPLFLGTLQSAAQSMLETKRHGEAMPLLSRLLVLRDQSEDKYSPDSIMIVAKLADLYFEGSRFVQATPLYERLIDATAKGKTIGDRKALLERVGETYARTGRQDEAARAYDQRARLALDRHSYTEAEGFAKKIQEAVGTSAKNAAQRANALNILGDIRAAQGKREDAEQFYREAVGLASGDQLLEASSLNGLGRLALKQKDLAGARLQLDRALSLINSGASSSAGRTRGLEAMVVANLAAVNAVAGDTPASLELYSKFLRIESATTVDDPPLIEYLDEAASFYARTPGKSEDVEDLYRRRLVASSRSFGNASPETAYAHYNLAELYALRKLYPRALETYREALRIFEALKGPESDEVVTIWTGIASTQAKNGEVDPSIETYKTLLLIAEKTQAADLRRRTSVLNSLALVYRQAGRHTEARETFQKIMAIWAAQGAAEPIWIAASKNTGISFLDEGLFKEGTAAFASLRATVRKAAGNRDSASELDIVRAFGQGLKRLNRNKEAEEANRQADQLEKRMTGKK